MQELAALHRIEKQRLLDEVARITDNMDRRHAQERSELELRVQQEEAHLREYEIARQRMEEAQRQLEAIKKTPSILSHRSQHVTEIESLARF